MPNDETTAEGTATSFGWTPVHADGDEVLDERESLICEAVSNTIANGIVRAVNSHAAMIEATACALEYLKHPEVADERELIEQLAAAIAMAKENKS